MELAGFDDPISSIFQRGCPCMVTSAFMARRSECICGLRQDTLVPVTAARWLATHLPDCSLVVCADATHQMYIGQEPLARVCGQLAAAAAPSPLTST